VWGNKKIKSRGAEANIFIREHHWLWGVGSRPHLLPTWRWCLSDNQK